MLKTKHANIRQWPHNSGFSHTHVSPIKLLPKEGPNWPCLLINIANLLPFMVKKMSEETVDPWVFSHYQIWASMKKFGHP